jgi:hypothetical protein
MDTINTARPPITGVVPLGTLRRNNRTLHLRHDTEEESGVRFKFAAGDGDERTELGAAIIPDKGGPERQWLTAALEVGIRKNDLVESGIIKALKGLARSIQTGKTLSAEHGFVKHPQCPHPFEVEELVPWRA